MRSPGDKHSEACGLSRGFGMTWRADV